MHTSIVARGQEKELQTHVNVKSLRGKHLCPRFTVGYETVKLLIISVPLDRVELIVFQVVAAVEPNRGTRDGNRWNLNTS